MKIGDLCTYAPKSSIKAGDAINNGKYMFFTSGADENKRYSNYQLDCEAIIMGTGGNATLHYYNGKFSTSTDCVVLIPNRSIRCKYLYYFFLYNINVLENGFKGAGLKHTNKNYISNIEIYNVPNIETQDKIIKALDMVFEIMFYYQQQLQKLDELVKSRFIELFGDPVYNTLNLPTKPLSELGSLDRGRSKHRPRNDPRLLGGPYPLIQTGEVSNAGLYITGYQNTYSELGLKQSKMWKAGTLCITIAANIAQTAILTFDACFPDSVVGFIPTDEINIIYMHYWFSFFQKILDEQAPQVAQKNINLKILSELQVAIPSIEEQSDFAAFVEQVDKSKFAVQQALDKAQLLFDSLMQKHFE